MAFAMPLLSTRTTDNLVVQANNQYWSSSTTATKWLVLLCKFSDDAKEPKSPSYFETLFQNKYPGLGHYWREVTYDQISIDGSKILGWLTMTKPKAYFVDYPNTKNESLNTNKLLANCGALVDAAINFNDYYGVIMYINGSVNGPYGVTQWGYPIPFDDVGRRYFPVTWIDAKSYNMALTAHEMAHGYGIRGHSYWYGLGTESGFTNSWDLTGGTCSWAAQDAIVGCVPLHPISPSKFAAVVAMIPSNRIITVAPFSPVISVTLERLAQPTTESPLMIKVPVIGYTDRYLTIEARFKAGYDDSPKVPGPAVLIHDVWPSYYLDGPAQTYTGRGFPGTDGSMWLPGDVFSGTGGITITVVTSNTSSFVVSVANNSSLYPSSYVYLPMTTRR